MCTNSKNSTATDCLNRVTNDMRIHLDANEPSVLVLHLSAALDTVNHFLNRLRYFMGLSST